MSLRRGPTLAAAFVAALIVLLLPAPAAARKPIIAYIEDGQLKRFDAETGAQRDPLSVPAFAGMRFAMSRNGRYVFYNDMADNLHLFDRDLGTVGEEVPLPGIDVFADPAFLTVSDNGLLGFDDNVNPPTALYDSANKAFVPTGFPETMDENLHRQPNLSSSGRFLATTCTMAAMCEVDLGTDSNPYVQDLLMGTDTAVPDDNTKDEEDPCLSGDGNLVGWHKPGPGGDRDLFLYDRSAMAALATANLNDAALNDDHCAIDSSGDYVGYMQDNVFKLYEVSSDSQVTLPAEPFELSNNVNNILHDPFSQSPRPQPPSTTPAGTAPIAAAAKKCKRGRKLVRRKGKLKCKRKKRKKKS